MRRKEETIPYEGVQAEFLIVLVVEVTHEALRFGAQNSRDLYKVLAVFIESHNEEGEFWFGPPEGDLQEKK